MNKVVKKFILYAMISVFVLLTALLAVINGINFTMAARDADMITQNISSNNGTIPTTNKNAPPKEPSAAPNDSPEEDQPVTEGLPLYMFVSGRERMGPSSANVLASVQYFTVLFDKKGDGEMIVFKMENSVVTEDAALIWAKSLMGEQPTGWTNTTYRYRVYAVGAKTYVTVIDQARELSPSFRILIISVVGEVVCLIISLLVLILVSRKLFRPLEEADRKQKRFISDIERQFKVPLTIVGANTEFIEKENGETEHTQAINRQIRKMTSLVKDLASLSVFDERALSTSSVNISDLAYAATDAYVGKFNERGISLSVDIDSGVTIEGDSVALGKMLAEMIDNALKFSVSKAVVSVKKEEGRICVRVWNDATLPDGNVENVFDRFTRLENAENVAGSGLGLSYVKDVAKVHNGRVYAKVSDGIYKISVHF